MSKSPSRPAAPFAVIELIAVLAIVGILVSILAPTFSKRTDPSGQSTSVTEPATSLPPKP